MLWEMACINCTHFWWCGCIKQCQSIQMNVTGRIVFYTWIGSNLSHLKQSQQDCIPDILHDGWQGPIWDSSKYCRILHNNIACHIQALKPLRKCWDFLHLRSEKIIFTDITMAKTQAHTGTLCWFLPLFWHQNVINKLVFITNLCPYIFLLSRKILYTLQ